MERVEIDVLGGDELVVGLGAQVFNVIDKKGVGEWLLDEENNLCATRGKAFDYFSAYASCSSLIQVLVDFPFDWS